MACADVRENIPMDGIPMKEVVAKATGTLMKRSISSYSRKRIGGTEVELPQPSFTVNAHKVSTTPTAVRPIGTVHLSVRNVNK